MMLLESVTLALPVAMASPELAELLLKVTLVTVEVPRFDMAPPRPPDVLLTKVLLINVRAALGWTLMPPPLIGAVLSLKVDRVTSAGPKTIRPPPPTLVAVLLLKVVVVKVRFEPALAPMPAPLAALFPVMMELLTDVVPAVWMAPPTPVVLALLMVKKSTFNVPPEATSKMRNAAAFSSRVIVAA